MLDPERATDGTSGRARFPSGPAIIPPTQNDKWALAQDHRSISCSVDGLAKTVALVRVAQPDEARVRGGAVLGQERHGITTFDDAMKEILVQREIAPEVENDKRVARHHYLAADERGFV